VSILYNRLENRAIATDTVVYAADTVQADTLAHMLDERSGIAVVSNKAADGVLYLNGHLFSFSLISTIIQDIL
jgi:hypothetical protein